MRHLNILTFLIVVPVIASALAMGMVPAKAQNNDTPPLPESIEGLVTKGAQVKYLGRTNGLDGWIMVYKGQEQYFYVTPDGGAFVSGLMFSSKGDPLTVRQVEALQKSGQGAILDSLVDRDPTSGAANPLRQQREKAAQMADSPAEQLYRDVAEGNWAPIGNGQQAPVVYAFIDPTCPHCHDFIQELKVDYLLPGKIDLRILPVSRVTDDDTILQRAAYILASPDPAQDVFAYLDGDEAALPSEGGLNTQAVQQNMAIMQKWKLNAIPFIIYKDKNNDVKIIQGKMSDPAALFADLG